MNEDKTETPEDEGEITLNETSLKRPLEAIDVIGGHGPWQFRQWMVFLMASFCNATILFSALFLPLQTFCFSEDTKIVRVSKSSGLDNNGTEHLKQMRNYIRNTTLFRGSGCNSTLCKTNASAFDVSSEKLLYEIECWNSQVETYVKCTYIVACMLSSVMVYFLNGRFGRRPMALISCMFLVVSSLGTSWANTPPVFLMLRFIASLGIFNIYLISAFSLMEYVYKDFKLLYFFTGHLGWGIAHFLLPSVSWMAKDWTSFNIILSVTVMILTIFVWWGPEMPSSFPKGSEISRARKTLKYAAFINGYSTTDVDLLSHSCRVRQEDKHDFRTMTSSKTKILCFMYSATIFVISFTSSFIYFATKWHPEWFKVATNKISFSFLGTTEVASTIILLFLTSVVAMKYLWTFVSMMSSALMIVIYSRTKGGSSTSSALLFTVIVFFASASWALLIAKSFCHKISNNVVKCNFIITTVAVFAGSLVASAVILKGDNQNILLIVAIPHLLSAIATAFVPDDYFGSVS